jgi:hypothetical protein
MGVSGSGTPARKGNIGARADGTRAGAKSTRQYTENKTPKERTASLKPGRGTTNPVK